MASVQVLADGRVVRNPEGNVIWVSVCLIKAGGINILFDVGEYQQRFVVRRRLNELGLTPQDIDIVVLSHLHWDHALNFEMFSSAQFVVRQVEEHAAHKNPPRDSATPAFLYASLHQAVHLIDPDSVTWPTAVDVLDVPGHTVGHVSLKVATPVGSVVLAGDACPNAEAMMTGNPDPVFYDRELALSSLERIRRASRIVVPGHGPAFYTDNGALAGREF
jgi:glyoxylase-like metal-dependent hydrolase (beta-lactamase superfamily II)